MLFEATGSGALPGVSYHLPIPKNMHSQHLLWALFRRDRPLSRWPQFEVDRLSSSASLQPALERCWDLISASEKVVISSEYLPSWTSEEIGALASRFQRAGFGRVHVLVYVREPAQAYLSLAQQHIRAADKFPPPHNFSSGYKRAIEKFETVFGKVEVRIFDRQRLQDGCAVRDFVSVLTREFGIQPVQEDLVIVNANDTLSAEAMIVLLEWRQTYFAGSNEVSDEGNRLVKALLSSRREIRQTRPALRESVAQTVRRANAGEIEYLRRLGIFFEHGGPENIDQTSQAMPTGQDALAILAHHDPVALSELRAFIQNRMNVQSQSQVRALRTNQKVFADHLNDRAWHLLNDQVCELHFIGASVTAQKLSWADALHDQLIRATGRPHEMTKNAMGGVGILFGLGHFFSPVMGRPRIAFIEFSTGDFNVGLSPPSELSWMIEALVARVRDEGGEVLIVHNWRADNLEADDPRAVFAAYDAVIRRCGVSTIRNNRWVDEQLLADPGHEKRLFRDVCHTTPAGAQAYAQHVFDALRLASPAVAIDGQRQAHKPVDWPEVLPLGAALIQGDTVGRFYEYSGTRQVIPFHELPSGASVIARVSGRLMGVGFISGPTSGWAGLFVDGKLKRRFRCFDQHSHYERYILLPLFIELHASLVELRLLDDPVDFTLALKQNPAFAAPRRVMPAHFIGTRLLAEPIR